MSTQPMASRQQKSQRQRVLQRRVIIAAIVLLFLVAAGILSILSAVKMISGIWFIILPIVLVVFAIAIPFVQALFPVTPIATDPEKPRPPLSAPPEPQNGPKTISNLPYRRNPYFTGREQALRTLQEQLVAHKAAALTQPQAISGLGGVGKTQVAVEYAYRHYDDYRHILWVNADTRDTAIASFLELAALLGLPEKQEQDQSKVVAAVTRWFPAHDQWLLIFDNADDLALADEFLPVSKTGQLLLTTRNQAPGTLANRVDIEAMDKHEGTLLLLRRARVLMNDAPPERAKPEDRMQAERIVEAMDGLPLALDQAAAYIEETGCSLGVYLERYQNQKAQVELLRRRGGTGKDHPLPVATTWSLSFAQVQQLNPAAADLLRACAFLAPDVIPEELIVSGASELGPQLASLKDNPAQLDEAIAVLRRFSLLRRDRGERAISIHRLVQTALLIEMNEQTKKIWVERVVRAVNKAYPGMEFKAWPQYERLLPHALRCAALIDKYTLNIAEAAHLLNWAGYYLHERAQYNDAEPLYQRALAIREQVRGSKHPSTATSLNNLAMLYDNMGKYQEAEPLYQRAIAIREQVQGSSHPDTATSLNNLAMLYNHQGKYKKAEPLYRRALAIREQVLGSNHPDVATTLNNLALLYKYQGRYEEAEPLYQRALAIRKQVLGSNHPLTASSLHNLAGLFDGMGKYEEAGLLYQQALAIYEQTLGSNHPDTATSLNNLALLYRHQSKYEEAEPLYRRALAIREQALGSNHPDVANSLSGLAELYRSQSRYKEAVPLYRQSLTIFEKALGLDYPTTRTVRENYEICLAEAKKRD